MSLTRLKLFELQQLSLSLGLTPASTRKKDLINEIEYLQKSRVQCIKPPCVIGYIPRETDNKDFCCTLNSAQTATLVEVADMEGVNMSWFKCYKKCLDTTRDKAALQKCGEKCNVTPPDCLHNATLGSLADARCSIKLKQASRAYQTSELICCKPNSWQQSTIMLENLSRKYRKLAEPTAIAFLQRATESLASGPQSMVKKLLQVCLFFLKATFLALRIALAFSWKFGPGVLAVLRILDKIILFIKNFRSNIDSIPEKLKNVIRPFVANIVGFFVVIFMCYALTFPTMQGAAWMIAQQAPRTLPFAWQFVLFMLNTILNVINMAFSVTSKIGISSFLKILHLLFGSISSLLAIMGTPAKALMGNISLPEVGLGGGATNSPLNIEQLTNETLIQTEDYRIFSQIIKMVSSEFSSGISVDDVFVKITTKFAKNLPKRRRN